MPKLKTAGSYIHDFEPMLRIQQSLTDAQIRELLLKHLGITDIEYHYGNGEGVLGRDYDFFMNKCFVNLEASPDADGLTLCLYNHDGYYSLCKYTDRPRG